MFDIKIFAGLVNGTAQAIANKQAAQPQQKKRKIKQGCTPCAAIAKVDATRQKLGYKIK